MPQIEWTKIAGMRDWLTYGYFHVNADIVWDVVEHKVPELKEAMVRFLEAGGA
jgi:uncharacterized protein with HEPN domain